jgi:hypothetical protein
MFPPERAPNVARLHATIQTQTIHVPPSCSQRHGGNSRQTDLAKLASQQPFCNGLRASATRFCLCLSPASNGSNVPPGLSFGPRRSCIQRCRSLVLVLMNGNRVNFAHGRRVRYAESASPLAPSTWRATSLPAGDQAFRGPHETNHTGPPAIHGL